MDVVTEETTTIIPDDDDHDILLYLQHNIWLPIILTLFLLGIIIGVFVYCMCRRRSYKSQYMSLSSLEDDYPQKFKNFDAEYSVETTKLVMHTDDTDTDLLLCQYYLKNTGSYLLVDHMPRLGRRKQKSWFLVRDYKSKHERIMTMQPRTRDFLLPFTRQTVHALNDLFSQLRHPFLVPCLEVDLIEHDTLVAVEPVSETGTLFDLIRGTHWSCSHEEKWFKKGHGLSLPQIQTYGRQVLEGLIYLNSQGLPPHRHLHSGNIIIRNYSACISGVHDNFLGLSSKFDNKFPEVVSFGHLIFEATTGQVMDTLEPQAHHMTALAFAGRVKQVMKYIFHNASESYPSLRSIRNLEFFQPVALPELQNATIPIVTFTPEIKSIVKAVKKQKAIASLKTSSSKISLTTGDPLTGRLERSNSQSTLSTISSKGTIKKEDRRPSTTSQSLVDEIKEKTKKMASNKSRERSDSLMSSGGTTISNFPPLILESQASTADIGKVAVPKSMVKSKPQPPPRPAAATIKEVPIAKVVQPTKGASTKGVSTKKGGQQKGTSSKGVPRPPPPPKDNLPSPQSIGAPLATSTPARSALLSDIRKGLKLKKTRKS